MGSTPTGATNIKGNDMPDKSNWELLTEEYYELYGRVYECSRTLDRYRFLGILDSYDDYYYVMDGMDGAGLQLLSCVGSPEGFDFHLVEDFVETICPWCKNKSLTLETYSDRFGPKKVLVEGLEHYVCSNDCLNDYETPQQLRARCDKIDEAYKQLEGA